MFSNVTGARVGSDWFSKVFGFQEGRYDRAKSRFELEEDGVRMYLRAKENKELNFKQGARYCVGNFSCPTLQQLRDQGSTVSMPGKLVVRNVLGDVAEKHAEGENRNATFQVASQFNCLEFTSPSKIPENGITGYASDRTQGPACSIACGPATAYRNYFAKVPEGPREGGQTREHMLDNLSDVGAVLGNDKQQLWRMQGGYSMADDSQLGRLNERLVEIEKAGRTDEARRALRIGLHEDVQVTATRWGNSRVEDPEQLVTQVFGSACAVAYNRSRPENWKPFATLVLEASYEATLWSAVLAAERHRGNPCGANIVYLTALGGGVFGNSMDWIETAMRRAFTVFKDHNLDIRIVTYSGSVPSGLRRLEREFPAE